MPRKLRAKLLTAPIFFDHQGGAVSLMKIRETRRHKAIRYTQRVMAAPRGCGLLLWALDSHDIKWFKSYLHIRELSQDG